MKRIQLPFIYQNHMMLQREKELLICGTCLTGRTVKIQLDTTTETVSVEKGQFCCHFPAQSAGVGKILTFYVDHENEPEITISDISIGELWLAAGQSNMEYFLRYDAHWNDTKKLPPNKNIRMFNMPQIAYEGQERDLPDSGYWFEEGDKAWAVFSAPGYYFARNIQPALDVPVGIIGCNWGGTPACAWMAESYLEKEPLSIFVKEYLDSVQNKSEDAMNQESMDAWAFEDSYHHQLEWRTMMYGLTLEEQAQWMEIHKADPVLPLGPYHHYRPSGLYHTMIEKLAPFSLKGILWYQGESDSGHAEIYDQTMTSLIACFRDAFADSTLPFLFTQLAPFGVWLDCTGENYEIIREKQDYVSKHVPHTAMISLMDLGMYEDIHPKHKREVGRRLALLARGSVYGESLLCESPELLSATLENCTITLDFAHAGTGLIWEGTPEKEFRITYQQQACFIYGCYVNQSKIIFTFSLPKTAIYSNTANSLPESTPCFDATDTTYEVSYCYQPYCSGNIWNNKKLPLKPFHVTLRF